MALFSLVCGTVSTESRCDWSSPLTQYAIEGYRSIPLIQALNGYTVASEGGGSDEEEESDEEEGKKGSSTSVELLRGT